MADAHSIALMAKTQDEFVRNAVDEHGNRLFGFIRNRVNDVSDAEDILQDVWYELTETSRLDVPVEQVAAWLFRVARNKIIDKYRKKSTVLLDDTYDSDDEDAPRLLDQLLPASDSDPSRRIDTELLMMAVEQALDELPPEQREVFLQHEMEDKSFKEISAQTGVPVNTLLSRKRYAILFLRKKLQDIYSELFKD